MRHSLPFAYRCVSIFLFSVICSATLTAQTLEVIEPFGLSSAGNIFALADDGTMVNPPHVRLPDGTIVSTERVFYYSVSPDGSRLGGNLDCRHGGVGHPLCPLCEGSTFFGQFIATWSNPPGSPVPLQWSYCCDDVSGVLAGISTDIEGTPMSRDGDVIVGHLDDDANSQFCGGTGVAAAAVWRDGDLTILPKPEGVTMTTAYGVSGDGNVIVGFADVVGNVEQAIRWVGPTNVLEELGPGEFAVAANFDGSVIVGEGYEGGSSAWIWHQGVGMSALSLFRVTDITDDGTTILNSSQIWNASFGTRDLTEYLLTDFGIDLTASAGWTSIQAQDMSSDGTKIAGKGRLNGENKVWLVSLAGNPDADGDGLLDYWEEIGIPLQDAFGNYLDENGDFVGSIDEAAHYVLDENGDGISDSDPNRKDIWIEVDRLANAARSASEIENILVTIEGVFDRAPVNNVNGAPDGINAHIMLDDETLLEDNSPEILTGGSAALGIRMANFNSQPAADAFGTDTEKNVAPQIPQPQRDELIRAILRAKGKAYRWALFARRLQSGGDEVSGLAALSNAGITYEHGHTIAVATRKSIPIPGGLPQVVDAPISELELTFLHELGHSLGLEGDNYPPNYVSVMNYLWEEMCIASPTGDCLLGPANFAAGTDTIPLDYSREKLQTISENDLDETTPIATSLYANYRIPHAYQRMVVQGQVCRCNAPGVLQTVYAIVPSVADVPTNSFCRDFDDGFGGVENWTFNVVDEEQYEQGVTTPLYSDTGQPDPNDGSCNPCCPTSIFPAQPLANETSAINNVDDLILGTQTNYDNSRAIPFSSSVSVDLNYFPDHVSPEFNQPTPGTVYEGQNDWEFITENRLLQPADFEPDLAQPFGPKPRVCGWTTEQRIWQEETFSAPVAPEAPATSVGNMAFMLISILVVGVLVSRQHRQPTCD